MRTNIIASAVGMGLIGGLLAACSAAENANSFGDEELGTAEQALCSPWPDCAIDEDPQVLLCNPTNCKSTTPCATPCKTSIGTLKTCGSYSTSSLRCQSCSSGCGATQSCSKQCLNGSSLTSCAGAGKTCASSCSVRCNDDTKCTSGCWLGSTSTTCAASGYECWDPLVDPDHDGLADQLERTLIDEFRPQFRLHSDETNAPSSVNFYLDRVHMRFHHANCSDCQIMDRGYVTATTMLQQSHQYKDGGFCSHGGDTVASTESDHFFLQIPNDSQESTVRKGDMASAKCYARVSSSFVPGAAHDIQYWVFYPYNGMSPGEHEGDWEHVTVSVKVDRTLHSVYFAAHDDEGCRIENPQLLPGTKRVIVFTANGSHASYPQAGFTDRGIYPTDYHDGRGMILSCNSLNTIHVGERDYPTSGNEWLRYGGRWGELGWGPVPSNGPKTPSFQAYWLPEHQQ